MGDRSNFFFPPSQLNSGFDETLSLPIKDLLEIGMQIDTAPSGIFETKPSAWEMGLKVLAIINAQD